MPGCHSTLRQGRVLPAADDDARRGAESFAGGVRGGRQHADCIRWHDATRQAASTENPQTLNRKPSPQDPRPDGAGVRACIQQALAETGTAAADVNYVNAHATSTSAGDLAEYR